MKQILDDEMGIQTCQRCLEIWNLCYFNCLTIRNLNLYYLISFLQTVSVIIATQLRIANLADPADCPIL